MEASVLMVWIGFDVNVRLGLLVLTAELVSTCMGKDLKGCTIVMHKWERTPCDPFLQYVSWIPNNEAEATCQSARYW